MQPSHTAASGFCSCRFRSLSLSRRCVSRSGPMPEASVRRRSAMVCTSSNCLQASRHPTIVLYSHHCMHRLHTGSRVLAEGCQMSSLRVKVADVPRLISWEATMLPVGDSICIDYRFDEVKYSRRFDLLTTIGFLTTLQLAAVLHSKSLKHLSFSKQLQAELRRLVSNGVCWMGVPCSSWVWMLLSCKFAVHMSISDTTIKISLCLRS